MKEFTKERRKNISQALLDRHYGKNSGITERFWGTRFYFIFNNLQRRCNSPKNNRYHRYGGRGIKCEWVNFRKFLEDMYPSYLEHCEKFSIDNTQIDRIDNDGNYCKENCRWATRVEQLRTQERTIRLEINGEIKSLREWSAFFGAEYKTVFARYKYGQKEKSVANLFKNKKKM